MGQLISLQLAFRQELPEVIGNLDYRIFRDRLERIGEIIELGNLDFKIVQYLIEESEHARRKESGKTGKPENPMSVKEIQLVQKVAREALRCTVARGLTGEAYRVFSAHLADSVLLQKFCYLDNIGGPVKVPSKSTIQRYEQMIPESVIREIVGELNKKASKGQNKGGGQVLKLEDAVSLDDYYADLSVLKTNVHFPVDWVLLIDAVRTLSKAIMWIRKSGIKNRMKGPETFMKIMNQLAIQMTHTRRRKDSRKEQKRILRLMKKMTVTIEKHAKRHRNLLETDWESVGLKAGHVKETLRRIEGVLTQLPQARKQAHERIIGNRQIKSSEKLLSLYEPDTQVIVRGKAGAEVEFGNKFFLGEQADGLVMDWKLYKDKAPSDSAALIESLDRLTYLPKQATGDRGLFSKRNVRILKKRGIQNNLCPRNIVEMQDRLQNKEFVRHQLRRGQLEGRISIMKNCFLGTPFRNKGFSSRERGFAWRVLAHNLWVLARMPRADTQPLPIPLAA